MAISPISNVSFSRAVSFGNNNGTSLIKAIPLVALMTVPTGCDTHYESPADVFNRTVGTEKEVPIKPSRKAADRNQPPILTAMDVVSSGNKTLYINGYSKKGEDSGVHRVELQFAKENPDGTVNEMYGQLTGFCLEPVESNYWATVKFQNPETGKYYPCVIAFNNTFGEALVQFLGRYKNERSSIAMYSRASEFRNYNESPAANLFDSEISAGLF